MKRSLLLLGAVAFLPVAGMNCVYAATDATTATGTAPQTAQEKQAENAKKEQECKDARDKREKDSKDSSVSKETKDANEKAVTDKCPKSCYDDPKTGKCNKLSKECQAFDAANPGFFRDVDAMCGFPSGTSGKIADVESSCNPNLNVGNPKLNQGLFQFFKSDCTDPSNGNIPNFTSADLGSPMMQAKCLCNEAHVFQSKFKAKYGMEPQAWQSYLFHQQREGIWGLLNNPNCQLGNPGCGINTANNGGQNLSTGGQFMQLYANKFAGIDGTTGAGQVVDLSKYASTGGTPVFNSNPSYVPTGTSSYGTNNGGYAMNPYGMGGFGNMGNGAYGMGGMVPVTTQNANGTTQASTVPAGQVASGPAGTDTWQCGNAQEVVLRAQAGNQQAKGCTLLKSN